ncbi:MULTISPECIES: DMT family transporter [unclassified Campylobacter]|uniref:DMT family transporter n=1 Tax=unclassified Campylobacter TaxID=2593542 RepID=UPI001237D30C|nr:MULTISPECIES: SMR family transporter [unclassified Campylobacter]KAA6224896.1 QacE family quaternary ammonium compound efflux SMR transporter [Campylobacter sp. LR185c]KAA6226319.1 QacE family quaternary ammonium compound efflux SMR transporter [Campylobacter sp. LR286c]KAA6226811.1 QacE family quaternary ammonium compound efflux SMR transporter [Campylobacter sp. LR196d]KAA6230248.1 QacE family quaternary ammonium compound efflux SMR transporter [Campylobacter sp. LR291e]KAA6233769.1 QacE 
MNYFLIIILSALLDIFANLMLKKSNAFENKFIGIIAILLAVLAFIALFFAIKIMPLSIAYSTWGCIGIIGTFLGGFIFFKEKLDIIGFLGLCLIIISVLLLNL